jgi:hypothetical protein
MAEIHDDNRTLLTATWPVPGLPPLVLFDSAPTGRLVGITATGRSTPVLERPVPGSQPVGSIGTPAALEAMTDVWYVATEDAVYGSEDSGSTWKPVVGAPE